MITAILLWLGFIGVITGNMIAGLGLMLAGVVHWRFGKQEIRR